ncbi:MAG: DUF4126 domain-containing protein [bacterium]|nr:DUF4126 domain-containing protein [bacterium]
MEAVLSVALGLGLAAACGFRVFVPLLVISAAGYSGHLSLSSSFDWIASTPALITLAVATALEIAAYYIPWVDHLLDTVASPAAVVAGVVASASVITGMDPYLKWTMAVIAGGGLAGAVQVVTTGTRGASTLTTAGFGNPIVSTAEAGGSLVLSLLAVIAPLAAVGLVVVFLAFVTSRLAGRRRKPA